MKYLSFIIILFLSVFIMPSCNQSESNEENNNIKIQDIKEEKILVKIQTIKKQTFHREIISNGRLTAIRKANLQFETNENIAAINVKNGNKVNKGQAIAKLESFKLENRYKQSQTQLSNAKLKLQDILLGLGFNRNDTTNVPKDIFETAKIKSGYSLALKDYELAKYNLTAGTLHAPFAGVIANLQTKIYNKASQSKPFCILIDNSQFEAEFSILENELSDVKNNLSVQIFPFATDTISYKGRISEINPMIDANGQIKVKALVRNQNNKLFEGMNVKIIIEISVYNQLIVPKQAVIIRSGKEVVFTYENGLSKWNYIKTGYENSTSYTITEGLKNNDKIITSGNLNLGHDAEVELSIVN